MAVQNANKNIEQVNDGQRGVAPGTVVDQRPTASTTDTPLDLGGVAGGKKTTSNTSYTLVQEGITTEIPNAKNNNTAQVSQTIGTDLGKASSSNDISPVSYKPGTTSGTPGSKNLGANGITPEEPGKSKESNVANDVLQSSSKTTVPGVTYSWDQQGKEKADKQYQQDVINARANAFQNAAQIKQNINQSQREADMMQYQNNQQAEKVGWTGGYVLDQKMAMKYLKATLEAEVYGAIELQKHGMDTSLASARIAYDLNQMEYAHQYELDAQNFALNEAQVTGIYISAPIKELLDQSSLASMNLEEQGYTYDDQLGTWVIKDADGKVLDKATEDNRDFKLWKTINGWFGSNNISYTGVKTITSIQQERAEALQWHTQLWTEYNAALQAAKADIDGNPTMFIKYTKDDEGNSIIDYTGARELEDLDETLSIGGEVKTIDLSSMSLEKLKDYIDEGGYKAKEQVISYYNWKAEQIIADNKTYDKDGNLTKINSDKITEELNKLQQESIDVTGQSLEIKGYEKPEEEQIQTSKLTKSTTINTKEFNQTRVFNDEEYLGDGSTWYKKSDLTYVNGTSQGNIYSIKYGTEYIITTKEKEGAYTTNDTTEQGNSATFDIDGTLIKSGTAMMLFDPITIAGFNIDKYNSGLGDDDLDINIGKNIRVYKPDGTLAGTGTKNKNYDLDIDWGATISAGYNANRYKEEEWTSIQNTLNTAYPNTINGGMVIYKDPYTNNNHVWIYIKQGDSGKWGYVQLNNGGKKLLQDLQTYQSGNLPDRWT